MDTKHLVGWRRNVAALLMLLLTLIVGLAAAARVSPASADLQNSVYIPLLREGEGDGPPQLPNIAYFTANPSTVTPGSISTLSWEVSNATSVSISPDLGTVSASSIAVNPTQSTEYILTATNARGQATARTTVTVSDALPPGGEGAIFPNRTVKTASASVRVDANGGIHAAYVYFTSYDEHPRAIYRYCPGPAHLCSEPTNWSPEVQLGDMVDEVQLALTPGGKPRLLFQSHRQSNAGKDFYYAECDQNCTNQAGWEVGFVTYKWGTDVVDVLDQDQPQRYFALDHLGRPRFVYYDRNYQIEPDHFGVFYAYCDSGCTDAGNWYLPQIGRSTSYDAEIFKYPSLAFTTEGHPRVIAQVFALNEDGSGADNGLYYLGCNSGCDDLASWQRLFLVPTGGGSYPHPGWDLELDANNRPRVMLFMGDGLEPPEINNRLLYLWCNNNCFDVNSHDWQFNNLGMDAEDGEAPDLELDSLGRPRVAWRDSLGSLGYSWCNDGCESDQPQWQHSIIETSDELQAEFPQAVPAHCQYPTWYTVAPVLSLDAAGNPRIGYDTPVRAQCLYVPPDNPDDPYHRWEYIWRAARFVFFPQP